ncbi:STN domain-containing protein [Orrella sp. JC864]|uniref:STN domain-containing protein n=1 Tax=Orrella sp. JC864 TaxID=3120298 RepID=UPI00300A5A21
MSIRLVAPPRAPLALIAMLSASLMAGQAWPAPPDEGGQTVLAGAGMLVFDLPALPLGAALVRYGELTRRSILYETRWVAGRQSGPLRGAMSPEAALDALLAGSGLTARMLSAGAVSVYPLAPAPTASGRAPGARVQARYDGYLQREVLQSLCARPALRVDGSRIVLRFSIDDRRRVADLRVRVAAHPALEPVVREALAGLALDPPPPGMAQPVLMTVAQDVGVWRHCPGSRP